MCREDLYRKGEWETFYASDGKVEGDRKLSFLATSPGDGHATRASQDWLSPQELASLAPPTHVPAGHREVIRHPETLARVREILLAGTSHEVP